MIKTEEEAFKVLNSVDTPMQAVKVLPDLIDWIKHNPETDAITGMERIWMVAGPLGDLLRRKMIKSEDTGYDKGDQ